ncbi:hypothetical protein D9757_002529 [Collybiopsis confluens]|uniref:BHLH domain-containing protein n=1 Tax=Collybiopsis confluens TaxID=2823264 RepID=A0A8H5HY06_9AGAR|nr:hypothetical protein D9757_002529 [Collybiopsis confluens]
MIPAHQQLPYSLPSFFMSDLLTPSESQVLQTFLSSMDYNDPNDVQNASNSDWTAYNDDGGQGHHHIPDVPHIQGREALAKATKDLMSLDADSWNSAPVMHQYQQQQHAYNFMNREHQSSQYNNYELQNHGQPGLYQQQQPRNEEYYLPKQGSQSPQPPLHHPAHSHLPQPLSISSHSAGSNMRSTYPSSMGSPPTPASSSSFSFGGSSARNSTVPSPPPSADPRSTSSSSNKRAAESNPYVPSNKRSRPSPPANPPSLPAKATLLSPSQKKANHIQSEQKRRANIRRGYEALCETVPALREAIRVEEEAQVAEGFAGNGKKPKRGRRVKVDDGTGEKIDGRAGPRSENIVLGKTIEYIRELLDDRQDLLTRLERARSSLSPDHPPFDPSDPPPLWEREWKGGSGKEADADEEEEEEEDE